MQHYAHVVDGVARERIDVPDDLTIGVDIFTEEFASALVACDAVVAAGDLWDGQSWKPAPAPPAPPVPDVSRAQARLQLHRAGLLKGVEAAIAAAGGEVAIWYADAATWRRANPYIAQIGAALTPPLTAGDIDDLFRAAALIDA